MKHWSGLQFQATMVRCLSDVIQTCMMCKAVLALAQCPAPNRNEATLSLAPHWVGLADVGVTLVTVRNVTQPCMVHACLEGSPAEADGSHRNARQRESENSGKVTTK